MDNADNQRGAARRDEPFHAGLVRTVVALETLPVTDIAIGERRRDDLGDIESLAVSIKRYGLLHPIVVDMDLNLAAGERRLRACQSLGWTEIEVKDLGSLSEKERHEIELEENLRRKDLTPEERSKTLVKRAQVAKEIAQEETQLRTDSVRNSRGRPREPGSSRDVAERLGVPPQTIRDAEQHVAAVEFYPELAPLAQYRVFKVAEALERLPPEERPAYRQRIAAAVDDTYYVERDIERRVVEMKQAKRRPRRLPASPAPPTPAQEGILAQQQLRGDYLRHQERAWSMLALRPRAIRKALEPSDMRDVRAFLVKLKNWLGEFEAEVS